MTPLLLAASAAELTDPMLYAAAYQIASATRREKTDRYRFESDRRLSLTAELLLRKALQMAGAENAPLEYGFGENGKPYLPRSPWRFSLSHSGEYALCALADCEVGCDVEKIAEADVLPLARRFFCPEEAHDIARQPSPEARRVRFYRYWTLKESFVKVTGKGLTLPLNEFQILLKDEPSVIFSGDSRQYTLREYADISGYRCALCAAGSCRETALQFVDPQAVIAGLFP